MPMAHHHGGHPPVGGVEEQHLLETDPVSGMKVFETPNAVTRAHDGTTYHFGGPLCAERFDADPGGILVAPGTHGEGEVTPEQKEEVVRRLQPEGREVAMADDGINDAPTLAQADVGIAMRNGTDVAMGSTGVTLVKGEPMGLARARSLCRATMRNICQKLAWAFGHNTVGVPNAAGVLYAFLGLLLSPMLAAAAMSFSSVSVITNALRLRKLEL
jgi:YHS domain-containing protein